MMVQGGLYRRIRFSGLDMTKGKQMIFHDLCRCLPWSCRRTCRTFTYSLSLHAGSLRYHANSAPVSLNICTLGTKLSEVKKTYAEEDRMAVQQQHAESYVKRAALFRSELQEVQPLSKKLSPLLITAAVFIGMACLSKIK